MCRVYGNSGLFPLLLGHVIFERSDGLASFDRVANVYEQTFYGSRKLRAHCAFLDPADSCATRNRFREGNAQRVDYGDQSGATEEPQGSEGKAHKEEYSDKPLAP